MMKHGWLCAVVIYVAFVGASQAAFAQADREGCKDYPLVTRIQGFYIEGCKEQAFATYKFNTTKGRVPVEGHYISISYRLPESAPEIAGVEMIRNYTHAVQAIGGEVMYEGRYSGSMKIMVDGREVWLEVAPYGKRAYRLDIVETQEMSQQVVADAAALLADLDRAGHVVLNGILFDTDKAVIKPESKPALVEIAKLLKENPEVEAFIVGHTDMSGSYEHNMELSEQRAAAVVEALVSDFAIAADRLTPRGIGPLAPVASNESEAGRALNRRVELVNR
jgi:outer membrane protein OmpA-like peptidoglycan-associated protein